MIRTFRSTITNGTTLMHDPCTGLTHEPGQPLAGARLRLDDTIVRTWPDVPANRVPSTHPISVCWSPIVRCNLACPYCLDDKTTTRLPPREMRRVARVLADSPILAVDISGGEPLLIRDLPALADQLTSGGLVVSVTTNGWHLARRVPALAGHIDAIRVSLDGATATTHDHLRRAPGSFDRAVNGIQTAVSAGIPVRVQTVLMNSTTPDAQAIVDLAISLHTTGVTFLQHLPLGDGAATNPDEALSDDQARAIVASLHVPASITVRLRERGAASGFTVVRADGRVYRNDENAENIAATRPLTGPSDLATFDLIERS